ncbi:MAG TPA: sialate O-acetylesterase [Mucilaginibacter sp.]|jgi:sialate O-acetylesterase|nr:sialate O-acetylesterase [Mucilaginibacter sp.]
MRKLFLLTIILTGFFAVAKAQLTTSKLFGDHMVLQRNQPIPVWGTAEKGAKVEVHFNGQHVNTRADDQGNWRVTLNPMKEGGPYNMIVESGRNTLAYTDVMMGEVWLCSGQSNMEFTLANALGFKNEQKVAHTYAIRQFHVPNKISLQPEKGVESGEWQVADENTVGNFTAVGYFFAKKLSQQLNVTVGLIHSSWGGTQAECWISKESQLTDPNLETRMKAMPTTWDRMKQVVDSTIKFYSFPNMPVTHYKIEELATQPPTFFDKWQKGTVGAWEWQGKWASYRGEGFMEHTVRLNANYTDKTSVLRLGQTDADMKMYINGNPITPSVVNGNFQVNLPAGTWKNGDNSVLIDLQSLQKNPSWWGIGINGDWTNTYLQFPDTLFTLADMNWHIMPDMSRPYHFDFSPNSAPTTLYNGMIAPLLPYPIEGVIWYQGEANANKAYQYRTTFPLLINDWRAKWGRQLPFLFVQLSSWGTMPNSNQGSDWAELREAQAMTLSLPNTAMAVTIDVGDANNIHPKDKADVGYRLANEALNLVYGMWNTNRSPLFKSVDFKDGYAIVTLTNIDNGLTVKDQYGYIRGFEVAGADHKFHFAKADIVGNQVKVWCDEVKQPVTVRYAWTNAPVEANLFNKEGYPVGPFRSDDWKGITEGK